MVKGRIGVLYEHPVWFIPLFEELERLGVKYDRLLAHELTFDPAHRQSLYSLVVNRMSPSAYLRGHGNAIFFVKDYLSHLESIGVDVINGKEAYATEISKARQLNIYRRLGVRHPRSRVISHPNQAFHATRGFQYPIIVKPNIGGSGALIQKFDVEDELRVASEKGAIDMGLDNVALVQEYLPARGGHIVRVEVLDGRYLYAFRVYPDAASGFNLCPADICQIDPNSSSKGEEVIAGYLCNTQRTRHRVEAFEPPEEVKETVLSLAKEGGFDLGGIEYLVNDRDGEIYYYDMNALSNFVTDAENVVGFNPYAHLASYIARRAGLTPRISMPPPGLKG